MSEASGNKILKDPEQKVVLTTTFNLLRGHQACIEGYRKLAQHLGGVDRYGPDKPINILTILESNGVDDALWSLRACAQNREQVEIVSRRLAIRFAEVVLPIYERRFPGDLRPRQAVIAAKDFLEGKIEKATLLTAWAAAGAAAEAAAWAAARAARAAARAARAAAEAAARAAARAGQAQFILTELAFAEDEVIA